MLAVYSGVLVLFAGCQMPWLPRTGNAPAMMNSGGRMVSSRTAGSQFEPVSSHPQRAVADVRPMDPMPNGMHYANHHAPPAAYGPTSQQTAWQQELPPRPAEPYGVNYPAQHGHYPAVEQIPAPLGAAQDGSMLRGRMARPAAPFYADEFTRVLPQSATERVIELSSDVARLQEDLGEVREVLERLKTDNSELRQMRQQQDLRLSSLEEELATSQQNEAATRSRFEMLVQRIELFNDRRQRQITDLHTIIDQLEDHLSQGDESPQVNDSPPPGQPVPEQTQTRSNPYRNSPGGLHVHLRSASR